MKKTAVLILACLSIFLFCPGFSLGNEDYIGLYENREYQGALDIILENLDEIYSRMVDDKRIPSGYISLRNLGEDVDLMALFRSRVEKGFFLGDNPELWKLHVYAARCNMGLLKRRDAINHYVQALRYREIEFERDDVIFYEIASVFRSYNSPEYFKAYTDALEQAYTLNRSNYVYSYELGMALSSTRDTGKAVYHLQRYVENTPNPVPEALLKIASLNDTRGRYLEAEKYYNLYLMEVPENGEIHFALGYIAYSRTGNYILAESSLQAALNYLDENDIYRRSKSYEYMGDMAYSNLKFEKAVFMYRAVLDFQQKVLTQLDQLNERYEELRGEVNSLKVDLIQQRDFEKYEEYEIKMDQMGDLERGIEILKNNFNRLNPGKVRWNLAEIYERMENLEDAVIYFRECIRYDYRSSEARERITKIQLKIKRGY